MKDKFAVSMFGQKRLSREGGIEIVVKELCTRMAQDGCQVTPTDLMNFGIHTIKLLLMVLVIWRHRVR